ncbi:putative reticulocyte-binding protein 2 like protein a [Halenospora varia]|nr:putative reticulocyte-binding protein 2 like protein a [Halenospora varia]
MVNYTQFSPRTISTEKAKLWNPSKTLEIINPDYDCLTCVGYAPSRGRRCRNPIRADNRALITRTLDEIAYLPPNSPAVMSRLRGIAGPALCVRYHQGQAETVVMQWQRKIPLLKPQIGEQKPAKPVQSSRLQEPARDRRVEDLRDQLKEMRDAIAKLREEIDSPRHQSQECEGPEERAVKDLQEEERKQRRSEERKREARRKESERLEKGRLEKERLEKECLAKEKREKEEKQRREREEAAANERIRQRAQKVREEREREKRKKEQKERKEWDQLWAKYQERWAQFKASASDIREGNIRDAIPWPVKSGLYRDAKDSNVKEFFQKAVSRDEDMAKLMRKECLKWHPDRRCTWLRDAQLSDVDKMMVDMICRVVTELLNGSARRSSEFLG